MNCKDSSCPRVSSLPVLMACRTSPHNHISQLLAKNLFFYLFTNPSITYLYYKFYFSGITLTYLFSKYESGPRPKSQWTLVRFYVRSIKSTHTCLKFKSYMISCHSLSYTFFSGIWQFCSKYQVLYEHHFNCFLNCKRPCGPIFLAGKCLFCSK